MDSQYSERETISQCNFFINYVTEYDSILRLPKADHMSRCINILRKRKNGTKSTIFFRMMVAAKSCSTYPFFLQYMLGCKCVDPEVVHFMEPGKRGLTLVEIAFDLDDHELVNALMLGGYSPFTSAYPNKFVFRCTNSRNVRVLKEPGDRVYRYISRLVMRGVHSRIPQTLFNLANAGVNLSMTKSFCEGRNYPIIYQLMNVIDCTPLKHTLFPRDYFDVREMDGYGNTIYHLSFFEDMSPTVISNMARYCDPGEKNSDGVTGRAILILHWMHGLLTDVEKFKLEDIGYLTIQDVMMACVVFMSAKVMDELQSVFMAIVLPTLYNAVMDPNFNRNEPVVGPEQLNELIVRFLPESRYALPLSLVECLQSFFYSQEQEERDRLSEWMVKAERFIGLNKLVYKGGRLVAPEDSYENLKSIVLGMIVLFRNQRSLDLASMFVEAIRRRSRHTVMYQMCLAEMMLVFERHNDTRLIDLIYKFPHMRKCSFLLCYVICSTSHYTMCSGRHRKKSAVRCYGAKMFSHFKYKLVRRVLKKCDTRSIFKTYNMQTNPVEVCIWSKEWKILDLLSKEADFDIDYVCSGGQSIRALLLQKADEIGRDRVNDFISRKGPKSLFCLSSSVLCKNNKKLFKQLKCYEGVYANALRHRM